MPENKDALLQHYHRTRAAIVSATARGLDASLYGEAPLVSSHEVLHTEWINRWRSEER